MGLGSHPTTPKLLSSLLPLYLGAEYLIWGGQEMNLPRRVEDLR